MGSISTYEFDVLIRGGGPLACAIARDAAGRGLQVLLSSTGDFGVDIRHHIVSCGLSYLSERHDYPDEDPEITLRVCPQIKSERLPVQPKRRIRIFPTKPALERRTHNCGSIANRFALLNARDASDRGAMLFSQSTLKTQATNDGLWQGTITPQNARNALSVSARVLIDTEAKPSSTESQFARVATFPCSADYEGFAKQRDNTTKFAFETGARTIAVGIIAADAPSEQDVVDFAYANGVHGVPIWMSDTFVPIDKIAKLQLTENPTQLLMPDTAPKGWRKLAEETVAELAPYVQMIGKKWTAFATLPGGDFEPDLRDALLSDLQQSHPNIDTAAMERLFSSYGTECHQIFNGSNDLGQHFGEGLFEAEVKWLVSQEWANTATDVLWRRTLLGMNFTKDQEEGLSKWMDRIQ